MGMQVSANYIYFDPDGDLEGSSSYQWYIPDGFGKDTAIPGATSLTYTPVSSDVGKSLKFGVIPHAQTGASAGDELKAAYTVWSDGSVQFSDTSLNVLENSGSSNIAVSRSGSGTGAVSADYSVLTGTASADDDYLTVSGTLNWSDGDTADKYIPVTIVDDTLLEGTEDLSITLNGTLIATGTPSSFTLQIIDDDLPLATNVSISGSPDLQQTLTGTYDFTDPQNDPETGSTYQWFTAEDALASRDTIYGATATDYTLTVNELDELVSFCVTPSDGIMPGNQVCSNWTTPVTGNHPPTAGNVVLSGTLKQGYMLTASYTYSDIENDLEGNSSYAWYRDSDGDGGLGKATAITGATGSSYIIKPEDEGQYISFGVSPTAQTGTSPGTEFRSSAYGPVISNHPPTVTNVTFTGTLQTGGMLTGSYTYNDIDNDIEGNSTYAWYRYSDNTGSKGKAISGATGTSYTLTSEDEGQYIRFGVIPVAQTGDLLGSELRSSFADPVVVTTTTNSSDFDGDGNPDLLWRNPSTGENRLWLMDDATLTGTASIQGLEGNNWQLVGKNDFNADDKPDLLWRNTTTGVNAIWYMDGLNYLSYAYLPEETDQSWRMVATADFNADGKVDIIWRNSTTGDNRIWYLDNTTLLNTASLDAETELAWQIAAAADFNADGKPDLVWRNTTTGDNRIWLMDDDSLLSSESFTALADLDWQLVDAADFNADGNPDLVWRHVTTGVNALWYMNGTSYVSYAFLDEETDLNWQLAGQTTTTSTPPPVTTGNNDDFNADGKPDLLWRNYTSGQNAVWYMDNATRLGYDYLPQLADINWQLAGKADFDGDTKPDLLWRNAVTGDNVIWYMDGITQLSYAYLPAITDTTWQLVGIGDFNSDSKPDLVWRNYSSGDNAVWYMDGASQLGYDYFPALADLNWQINAVDDFNADGKPDLVWRNYASGDNAVWYMDNVTQLSYDYFPALGDINWQITGTGDFNTDDKPDLLWRNGATGDNVVWYLDGVNRLGYEYFPVLPGEDWRLVGR
ncbi:FG-GAP repeat protein [Candidatus Venteria ishoeyi]|uniref:FG-GAP repeat protein n=2 Tax=Candidatus Venteria ishoeyi TaxID=1899563 RepID=A0A1H6FEU9_9GAMM|nr:FG-GAP repeat protein [Candidatus Venteria ishoeyi]